ncbi:unnamed protein product, partial [Protopolystoma xenopodis]
MTGIVLPKTHIRPSQQHKFRCSPRTPADCRRAAKIRNASREPKKPGPRGPEEAFPRLRPTSGTRFRDWTAAASARMKPARPPLPNRAGRLVRTRIGLALPLDHSKRLSVARMLRRSSNQRSIKAAALSTSMSSSFIEGPFPSSHKLTPLERTFLDSAERGDKSTLARCLSCPRPVNVNCVNMLGRTAIQIAVDNENVEIVELLLRHPEIHIGDALLYAIQEGVYRIVEMLIDHGSISKEMLGTSWARPANISLNRLGNDESHDFASDISPVMLAAICNQFEILQLLLNRGARIDRPHQSSCDCDRCLYLLKHDSLKHTLQRINTYKALASPAWISLTSSDPLLTAFKLSWELCYLASRENEFKEMFNQLSEQCRRYACDLLDQCRSSGEVIALLNKYDSADSNNSSGSDSSTSSSSSSSSSSPPPSIYSPYSSHSPYSLHASPSSAASYPAPSPAPSSSAAAAAAASPFSSSSSSSSSDKDDNDDNHDKCEVANESPSCGVKKKKKKKGNKNKKNNKKVEAMPVSVRFRKGVENHEPPPKAPEATKQTGSRLESDQPRADGEMKMMMTNSAIKKRSLSGWDSPLRPDVGTAKVSVRSGDLTGAGYSDEAQRNRMTGCRGGSGSKEPEVCSGVPAKTTLGGRGAPREPAAEVRQTATAATGKKAGESEELFGPAELMGFSTLQNMALFK